MFDWGPRPFRFLNCWLEDRDFKTFVEEKWRDFNVIGRGAFVLKEKLKLLKKEIGAWNKNQFGDLNAKMKILQEKMRYLELICEERRKRS